MGVTFVFVGAFGMAIAAPRWVNVKVLVQVVVIFF